MLGFVFMLLVDQCSTRKSGGKERSMTATLGLVVHAAADGVALGAAATTSQADVELIVFVAIMLHKVNFHLYYSFLLTNWLVSIFNVFNLIQTISRIFLQAPAAFGLVSFLLHEGVDRKRIGRHLLIFSLSAPCLALITYFGIGKVSTIFSQQKYEIESIMKKEQIKNFVCCLCDRREKKL